MSLPVMSLSDALIHELRSRIMAGELGPGEVVADLALAKQYDVARPTAQAVVTRLVAEGLLERAPHRSARVPVMDVGRVHDMYGARRLVESACYRLLAKSRFVPESAERANESLRSAADEGELLELVEPDIQFHRALVDELGNTRISRMHSALVNEMRMCLAQVQAHKLLDPRVIAAEHDSIMVAIREGKGARAAKHGRAHLDHAEMQLTQFLTHKG